MTDSFKKLFADLCAINGGSGAEDAVRQFILDKITDKCHNVTVNKAGCIIAEKKGSNPAKNKVMLSAHMDEVALIVTYINENGTLKFAPVGGVDPDVCAGRQISVNGGYGVTGTAAIHNLTDEQRKKPLKFDDLHIDIGSMSKAETEQKVSLGDYAYFADEYVENGSYVTSKAIDDRAGCALMIDMICNGRLEHDAVFAFVTREEVGLRGAGTAAYDIDPDYAVVIEATTAADIPLAKGDKQCCFCGKGAVVSYMDRSTVYDRGLYKAALKIAAEKNIPVQTKMVVAGGNDSGIIHVTRGGIPTAAVSVPCRYLHSPSCTARLDDIESVGRLAAALADYCAALDEKN